VPGLRRYLVSNDRSEESAYSGTRHGRRKIRMEIMICRNGKFDSLAGQRYHPLVDRRISMSAVRKCVNVGIATNQSGSGHLPADPQAHVANFSGGDFHLLRRHSPFEPARCKNRAASTLELEAGPPASRVDNTRSHREWRALDAFGQRRRDDRRKRSVFVNYRDTARQRRTFRVSHSDIQRRIVRIRDRS
jgi:hypothetical protein